MTDYSVSTFIRAMGQQGVRLQELPAEKLADSDVLCMRPFRVSSSATVYVFFSEAVVTGVTIYSYNVPGSKLDGLTAYVTAAQILRPVSKLAMEGILLSIGVGNSAKLGQAARLQGEPAFEYWSAVRTKRVELGIKRDE